MTIKFAVLGGSGFVGSEVCDQITSRGHVLIRIDRSKTDIYSPESLAAELKYTQADALINCAGYTGKPNVDACESDKVECLKANAILPGVINEACSMQGVKWGHVSSGCIYTGCKSEEEGFSELDPPNFSFRQNNCSWYSGTKALGEEVLGGSENLYIWRLRIPFSNRDNPRNYLTKVLNYDRLLEATNSLSNLKEFAIACIESFEKNIAPGIYNLTNPGKVTTTEVAELIKGSGVSNKVFQFFKDEEEFMATAAISRRSNCLLDSSKAINAGLNLSPIRESIVESLRNWDRT